MALTIGQQTQFKYFCKICKKGFLCGRALGGHMRAHGIGEEGEYLDDDDDDQTSDWEDSNTPQGGKSMYTLRTNLNRKKCYRPYGSSLAKRKRSFRTNASNFAPNTCPSNEEEDLANCLMMLSNTYKLEQLSSASPSKGEERQNPITLITSSTTQAPPTLDYKANKGNSSMNSQGLFECKACKKVFTSHQALGGHRASHKKVKGCFASRLDHLDQDSLGNEDNQAIVDDLDFIRPTKSRSTTLQLEHESSQSPLAMPERRSKVHECSICHRVFDSGQALGGHKRCHWITSNVPDPSNLARFQELQEHIEQMKEMPMLNNDRLDLNIPTSTLSFEVSTDKLLQPWTTTAAGVNVGNDHHNNHHKPPQEKEYSGGQKKNTTNDYGDQILPSNNKEDEANSKMKLARICEIKNHMSTNGCSSPWLKVGIGSSNQLEANP